MRFSIITVNYNNKDGLEKTITSVMAQTFKDFEHIIVDGGSTDGSLEIIEKYKDHFAWWCSEPDGGVYSAMNKGIDHAKGDYLNFMNSGDCFYDENTLNAVASERMDADVIYGDWVRWFNGDDQVLMKAPPITDFTYFFYGENICHQAMFIRGEMHRGDKYEEKYKVLADWALWQKLSFDKRSFQYLPHTICLYDANSGLSEKRSGMMQRERFIIRLKHPISFLFLIIRRIPYYVKRVTSNR